MIIKIFYFARVKEIVNYSTEDIELPDDVFNVMALKQYLCGRGEPWMGLFNGKQVIRAAINHELVDDFTKIKQGDEIAFFPPVTGG